MCFPEVIKILQKAIDHTQFKNYSGLEVIIGQALNSCHAKEGLELFIKI